jgi:hypothetical protein
VKGLAESEAAAGRGLRTQRADRFRSRPRRGGLDDEAFNLVFDLGGARTVRTVGVRGAAMTLLGALPDFKFFPVLNPPSPAFEPPALNFAVGSLSCGCLSVTCLERYEWRTLTIGARASSTVSFSFSFSAPDPSISTSTRAIPPYSLSFASASSFPSQPPSHPPFHPYPSCPPIPPPSSQPQHLST